MLYHPASSLTLLRLDHRFGPTLMYPSTTQGPDDMASVIMPVLPGGGFQSRTYLPIICYLFCSIIAHLA